MESVSTQRDIGVAVKHVIGLVRRLSSPPINAALADSGSSPLVHTHLQVVFNAKMPNAIERAVYELLVTHGILAEKLGAGGFDRFLTQLLDIFDNPRLGCMHPTERRVFEGCEWARSGVARRHDVTAAIAWHVPASDRQTRAMLAEALRLAGFAGRVLVEKTRGVPSVELVRGYSFDLLQLLPIDCSLARPRIACIDGYVEEVSELHRLLEASAAAREPCVLFVRGMSDDVKHTLRVNYDRGALCVIPVGVKFDLEGMNTLADIAVVTGTDVVSSLKGELISSLEYASMPVVDQVTMHRGRVVINSSLTHRVVSQHVSHLRQRRSDEQVDEKGVLLDKRIRSLSPNHVIMRLQDDKGFVVKSQAIDHVLRAVKSLVDFGVLGNERRLAATELAAAVHAEKCAAELLLLGAFVRA